MNNNNNNVCWLFILSLFTLRKGTHSETHLTNEWCECSLMTSVAASLAHFTNSSTDLDQSKQCGVKRSWNSWKMLQCVVLSFGSDQIKWTRDVKDVVCSTHSNRMYCGTWKKTCWGDGDELWYCHICILFALADDLLHVMKRRRDALHRLEWRRENKCRLQRQVYSNNRQCSLHFVGSDRGRIAFMTQTSCAIVHLWAGQDHLSKELRLFWSACRVDCSVHTCPNDPH